MLSIAYFMGNNTGRGGKSGVTGMWIGFDFISEGLIIKELGSDIWGASLSNKLLYSG